MKPLLLTLAATLLFAAPAQASLQHDLDKLVDTGVPGAIAYSRDGGQTTRLAAGYGELATRTPMRATDRFRAGSVTKAFTATVILQLAGERKLSLDDTVEAYVPGGDGITIRQLLNMSSGLADYLGDDPTVFDSLGSGRVFTPQELVGFAAAHPPHFAPGTSWTYCNTCYVVLGMIAEEATGRPIETELRERVFAPAGLRGTSFGTAIRGPHAHGYFAGTDVTALEQSWSWTAGALVSTADDIARFYRALLGGELLKRAQMRELQTVFPTEFAFGPGILTGYATGIFRMRMPCGIAWGHDGGTPGYRTFTLSSDRRQAVVMINRDEDELTERQTKALNRAITTAYCAR